MKERPEQSKKNTEVEKTDVNNDKDDQNPAGADKTNDGGTRPILHLTSVKEEPLEYQPSPVIIKTPPSWAKRFSDSIVAPVVDEKWKAAQPSMKGSQDFVPLQLNEEEKSTAEVELTVMKLLLEIRDKVENSADKQKASGTSSEDDETTSQFNDETNITTSAATDDELTVANAENAPKTGVINCGKGNSKSVESNAVLLQEDSEEAGAEEFIVHTPKIKDEPESNEINEVTEEVEINEQQLLSGDAAGKSSEQHFDLRSRITNKRNEVDINQNKKRHRSVSVETENGHFKQTKYRRFYSDQMEVTPVPEELDHMRRKGIGTDCDIKVGGKTFKCHSLILMRNSVYFRENLCDTSGYEVVIEDVKAKVFEIILDYLYLSKVNLKSFDEAEDVLAASVALRMPELVKFCTKFCTQQLVGEHSTFWTTMDNLLKDQAEPYQLNFYQIKTFNTLLLNADFYNISFNTLHFVVEQRYLTRCSEKILIECVEAWAKHHLRNSEVEITHENIRSIVGPVFGKLRYLCLNQKELVTLFDKTQLLSEREKLEILEKSVTRGSRPLSEVICHRKFSRDITSATIFNIPKISGSVYVQKRTAKISCSFEFTPTTDILLLNFQYYTQTLPFRKRKNVYNEQFTAQILRLQDSKVEILREVSASMEVEYDSIIRVKLPVPVLLRRSKQYSYSIRLILSSTGTYNTQPFDYMQMEYFEKYYIKPHASDWSWGNEGIFTSLNYKILK